MWCKIDYIAPARNAEDCVYDTHQWTPAQRLNDLPALQEAIKQRNTQIKRAKMANNSASQQKRHMSKHARAFLDHASLHAFEPVHILFGRLGTISPAAQTKIVNELERLEMVNFVKLRLGKSYVRLQRLTENAWKYLQKSPTVHYGKGGIAHSHICHWQHEVFTRRGYSKVQTEWQVPGTNHSSDVGYQKGRDWHAVEVVVDCFTNIADHTRACLVQSNSVKSLTFVTAVKSDWERIRMEIMAHTDLVFCVNQLKFEVAETCMKEIY